MGARKENTKARIRSGWKDLIFYQFLFLQSSNKGEHLYTQFSFEVIMATFQAIKTTLEAGEILSEPEINQLGFKGTPDLLSFMEEVTIREIQNCVQKYPFSRLNGGYQTQTLHHPDLEFVIKRLVEDGDRPTHESIQDFEVAKRKGGGLVTPFAFLQKKSAVYGLAAPKIKKKN